MDLSKHFKLEDFVEDHVTANLRRICVNILEPIQQRFGIVTVLKLHGDFLDYCVAFKVVGFDNKIIAEYIENSLVHSFVRVGNEWIYVECDPDA